MWIEFEKARPRLLGAVFDTLSQAMALRNSVQLPKMPRMADFARWGCAIALALGYSEHDFLTAYEYDEKKRNDESLRGSPVASMVIELMEEQPEWEGTPSELSLIHI